MDPLRTDPEAGKPAPGTPPNPKDPPRSLENEYAFCSLGLAVLLVAAVVACVALDTTRARNEAELRRVGRLAEKYLEERNDAWEAASHRVHQPGGGWRVENPSQDDWRAVCRVLAADRRKRDLAVVALRGVRPGPSRRAVLVLESFSGRWAATQPLEFLPPTEPGDFLFDVTPILRGLGEKATKNHVFSPKALDAHDDQPLEYETVALELWSEGRPPRR